MKRLPIAAAALVLTGIAAAVHTTSGIHPEVYDRCGATVGINPDRPEVHLIFTADSMFEGGAYALDVMRDRGVHASFFFTGNFLREPANEAIVRRVIAEGHYLGPHSDRHILLADWDEARTMLATPDSALRDIEANYAELVRFGIQRDSATWIVPPYEWYRAEHIAAYRAAGLRPVNPSPSIQTYRDYTTPDMPDYHSSDSMWHQLMERERTHGLRGAVIILHLGTQDVRTDKFYHRLGDIIDTLRTRGYQFRTVQSVK